MGLQAVALLYGQAATRYAHLTVYYSPWWSLAPSASLSITWTDLASTTRGLMQREAILSSWSLENEHLCSVSTISIGAMIACLRPSCRWLIERAVAIWCSREVGALETGRNRYASWKVHGGQRHSSVCWWKQNREPNMRRGYEYARSHWQKQVRHDSLRETPTRSDVL